MDFVQLSVDTLNEAIKLEGHKNQLGADELSQNISRQKPRYTFFRFREEESQPTCELFSPPHSPQSSSTRCRPRPRARSRS